ncbi:MAG: hypothetical protein VB064_07070 [Oscillospiraceae bacterium]|nr:hypothetical protein [Oscillospiraceae bacterium]
MKMNLKPAFRYQFQGALKSAIVFSLIMLAVLAIFSVVTVGGYGESRATFIGYGVSAAIFMFVMGIVSIRSDLRLCLQFGVSRRTAFVSEILALLTLSAVLAVTGELITGLAQAAVLNAPSEHVFVCDLYQIIYLKSGFVQLSFAQHIMSALVNTGLLLSLTMTGMFFSLLFWRLSKVWTVLVAISIPILLNLVPWLLLKVGFNPAPFVAWVLRSPFYYVLTCLAVAVFFGIINWFLLRVANIKAAK